MRPSPAGTIAPAVIGSAADSTIRWVPRLGRMIGTSASSCSSAGPQPVGPHAGGVDHVGGADLELVAGLRVPQRARRPRARRPRAARRASSRLAPPRRSARPRPARSARAARRRSGSRRRGSRRSASGRPARAAARAPRGRRSTRWRAGLQSVSSRPAGAAAAGPRPSRRRRSGPSPTTRSSRVPSNAGTTKRSGLTRWGARLTLIWRSSSASRTSPRSKFCR